MSQEILTHFCFQKYIIYEYFDTIIKSGGDVMLLLFMLFFHVVDDWVLQGKLGTMKQQSWWLNHPEYKDM